MNENILKKAKNGQYGVTLIDDSELAEVASVLSSKNLFRYESDNSKTWQLEKKLTRWFGVKRALALCNGTAALKAALVACNVQQGDEVCLGPYTFIATVNAVLAIGAIPVFVDLNESLSMKVEDFERKLSNKTKALININIQGDGSEIDQLIQICQKNGIKIIEDCAQSFGARINGQLVGTRSDISCFSLQSNKLVGCGEGGFLLTSDSKLYETARNYHDQGAFRPENTFGNWDNKNALFGDNLKISELQAAVASIQVDRATMIIEKLNKNITYLRKNLSLKSKFRLRDVADPYGGNGVSLPLICNDTNRLTKTLNDLGQKYSLPITPLYNEVVYKLGVFSNPAIVNSIDLKGMNCSDAENLSVRFFWLHNSLEYTVEELDYIIQIMNSYDKEDEK